MSKERVTFTVGLAVDCAAWRREYDTDEPNSDIVRVVQERMLYRAQDALGPGVNVFAVSRKESQP